MENEILSNIQKMHSNVVKDQKIYILSLVAYDNLKIQLIQIEFNFSNKKFITAKIKREKNIFSLNNYKRFIPYSKKKLNGLEKSN